MISFWKLRRNFLNKVYDAQKPTTTHLSSLQPPNLISKPLATPSSLFLPQTYAPDDQMPDPRCNLSRDDSSTSLSPSR